MTIGTRDRGSSHLHLLVSFCLLFDQAAAFSPSVASKSQLFCSNLDAVATVNGVGELPSSAASVASDIDQSTDVPKGIRPLQNNWWPVSVVTSLQADRPNAIELLGQKLVLFREDGGTNDQGEWQCLADQCAHRFAPLSEGRVVPKSDSVGGDSGGCASCTLQCAYHGWEFQGDGKCTKVPQQSTSSSVSIDERKVSSVPSYPVREDSGMLWVWSNPDETTWNLANSIPLPISPLIRSTFEKFGGHACFMRDLPYGMELLGENLMDLAHLPFSHHSVGGLDREFGGELPLRVMSEQERVDYATWEKEFGNEDYSVPLYQVEVVNATQTDPILLLIANRFPSGVSDTASATISFFDACHVRYRREPTPGNFGHVELFMSPTGAGKSRVFLWNAFHRPAAPGPENPTLKSRLAKLSPIAALKKVLISKLMNPATVRSHSSSHFIFDGDGIFLHKQGDRMRRKSLSYRDYSTPSSCDVLLNSFRRYLDSAARLAMEQSESDDPAGIGKAAATAVSFEGTGNGYSDSLPREELLDRYNSHTKHCAICSAELERCERKRSVYQTAKTALTGAGGASTVALLVGLAPGAALPASIGRLAGIGVASSIFGSMGLSKLKRNIDKKIESFYFEDYVHAEKN